MNYDCDVCIVGSGAGGSPIAYELSKTGKKVIVLEKGSWYTEKDFSKDEIACCRRSVYTPNLKDEFHVIEDSNSKGAWKAKSTFDTGRDFWNGNCVGGSSNFMSGYFHRLKPKDFRLLSEFGPIKGANIVDWPISYEDLEPYYTKVEKIVGISGRVVNHPNLEPRSTKDYPYPPLAEHKVASMIDDACSNLGITSLPVARAILSKPKEGRKPCYYSNYCGSYGCSSGAKGGARAALLNSAIKTSNCEIRANSFVYYVETDSKGNVSNIKYYNKEGKKKEVKAKLYVVACQAIETSRLLLQSKGEKHKDGLGNNSGQLGKNLIFSAGGSGQGTIKYDKYSDKEVRDLKIEGPFVNRSLQDWYYLKDKKFSGSAKGGTIDFLFKHANPIRRAISQKWGKDGLIWGAELQNKIKEHFSSARYLRFEVFNDWLPTDNCFVSLDSSNKDKWGSSVAKVRVGYHEHDLKVGRFLSKKAKLVLKQMRLSDVYSSVSGSPPPNLVAGGCRFGDDDSSSVLDRNCKVHGVDNLYVTDASFMPTGGSVPYTWTIYANSFRVADKIKEVVKSV